jgi:hypothetical protein
LACFQLARSLIVFTWKAVYCAQGRKHRSG